jgi:hypothetical protein
VQRLCIVSGGNAKQVGDAIDWRKFAFLDHQPELLLFLAFGFCLGQCALTRRVTCA